MIVFGFFDLVLGVELWLIGDFWDLGEEEVFFGRFLFIMEVFKGDFEFLFCIFFLIFLEEDSVLFGMFLVFLFFLLLVVVFFLMGINFWFVVLWDFFFFFCWRLWFGFYDRLIWLGRGGFLFWCFGCIWVWLRSWFWIRLVLRNFFWVFVVNMCY